MIAPGKVISTILKHDNKQTSYKIALLRAINDVVLSFPDMHTHGKDIAVPLRMLAEYWVAYYWPFVAEGSPILQGPQSMRGDRLSNDILFRPSLTRFRLEWEKVSGGASRPSDGFFILNELRVPRKLTSYPIQFLEAYRSSLRAICDALQKPIRHAGPGEWTVFDKPARYASLGCRCVPIPGTKDTDACLVIGSALWQTFRELSLWVEALCIHEWCLFTERTRQENDKRFDRGKTYVRLTDRPGNRRPLTWERNHVDLLLMEGKEFVCPWTEQRIHTGVEYDIDHLVPVSVYPINELWNLVPSNPSFNMHAKGSKLPSPERLARAQPHLIRAYSHYDVSEILSTAIREDVAVRFSTIQSDADFPQSVAQAAIGFIDEVAAARNLARFD